MFSIIWTMKFEVRWCSCFSFTSHLHLQFTLQEKNTCNHRKIHHRCEFDPCDSPTLETLKNRLGKLQHVTKVNGIPSRELTYPTFGKRKIIFKIPFLGDMLVPWRVSYLFCLNAFLSLYMGTSKKMDCTYFGSTFLAGGIFINISRTCQVTQPHDPRHNPNPVLSGSRSNLSWSPQEKPPVEKPDCFHKCGEHIIQPCNEKKILFLKEIMTC